MFFLNSFARDFSLPRLQKRRFLVISSLDHKEPNMAETSWKARLTAELLQLTKQQHKALEDATFLGWQPGQVEAYQQRGERVSLLRQRLALAIAEERLEVSPDTLPVTPDFDSKPS
jgi:hypothetical protein